MSLSVSVPCSLGSTRVLALALGVGLAAVACRSTADTVSSHQGGDSAPTAPSEDCTNGVDDDGDGAADCADPDCASDVACACGNGVIDNGEACDGADLGGLGCGDLGFDGGTLACTGACGYDTSACTTIEVCNDGVDNDGDGAVDCHDSDCATDASCPACGNGVIDPSEDCDGAEIGGVSCTDIGYDGGVLGCTPGCEFDESVCADEVCDDGIDNDLDGFVDCQDSDCAARASCNCGDYTTTTSGAMVYVSAGTFTMGGGVADTADLYLDHEVTLTHDFYIGQNEVTRSEWEWDPDNTCWDYTSMDYGYPCTGTAADCPADSMTWHEAARYANWVSDQEGLDDCYLADGSDLAAAYVSNPYACDGYRLPTEAEWEFAARAGEDTEYSGSDTSTEVAWTSENAGDTGTFGHEVCTLAANAWGLCDMSGNVFEWVGDWYDVTDGYSDGLPDTDPAGPSSGSFRVVRGGGWRSEANEYRIAARDDADAPPDYADYDFGFRLVRSSP